ncbi:hypothetical protein [Rhizobium sp. NLR3b]|nr:hypothetical protein [Rhizobium sp. NLR3b]
MSAELAELSRNQAALSGNAKSCSVVIVIEVVNGRSTLRRKESVQI